MNIRKGKNGELNKIIDTANKSFATERPVGYDFKKSVAKVYDNKNIDYSSSHFVLQDADGSFVAKGFYNDFVRLYSQIFSGESPRASNAVSASLPFASVGVENPHFNRLLVQLF